MDYIVDKNGIKREAGKCTCEFCRKEFLKELRQIRRNQQRGSRFYCSLECKYKSISKKIELICSYCGKVFPRNTSKIKNSKSGLYFCCRECKDKAQKVDSGFIEIYPNHYKDGKSSYRKRAFYFYGEACTVCGYNIKDVLEVHHRDCDRKNGNITNLDVLCPTHHTEYQLGIRKYT